MVVVFLLLWSAITLSLLGFMADGAVQQIRALSYPNVPGLVTESQVIRRSKTSGIRLRYHYVVGEREFEGDRLRFGGGEGESGDWAARTVATLPPGKKVVVHYDPVSPDRAVLVAGIEGADLVWFQFAMPFTVVMLAGWTEAWRRTPWGRALRSDTEVPDGFGPFTVGLVAFGLAAFIGLFPVLFTKGFHPPLALMITIWCLLISIGFGAGTFAWWKKRMGAASFAGGQR